MNSHSGPGYPMWEILSYFNIIEYMNIFIINYYYSNENKADTNYVIYLHILDIRTINLRILDIRTIRLRILDIRTNKLRIE